MREVNGRGATALAQLGARNAARNPARSLLTAALLASAAFLLVAVESFPPPAGAEFLDKNGGSGGFNLIAEADVPLYEPLKVDEHRRGLRAAVACERRRRQLHEPFQATRPRVLGVPESLIERGGVQVLRDASQRRRRRRRIRGCC